MYITEQMISYLTDHPSSTPAQVAEGLGHDRARIGSMLSMLYKRGKLTREPSGIGYEYSVDPYADHTPPAVLRQASKIVYEVAPRMAKFIEPHLKDLARKYEAS